MIHRLTHTTTNAKGYHSGLCSVCCQQLCWRGPVPEVEGCPGTMYVPTAPEPNPPDNGPPPSVPASSPGIPESSPYPPGGPIATTAEFKRRLLICTRCGRLETCAPSICAKRKLWETGVCPAGKWEPPYAYTPPTSEGRTELPAITTRHLIYHVYAAKANDVWKANLRQLTKRWGVFNGRRIIAVATEPEAESLATVKSCLRSLLGDDALTVEWLTVPNDPELREVATFPELLRTVRTTDPNSSVFFAHTKGVAPWGNPRPDGIAPWRDNMYSALLDDPAKIDVLLRYWPTVGATKIIWRQPGERLSGQPWMDDQGQGGSPYPTGLVYGEWLFAGTYWWVRCDSLFNNWRWPFVPHDHYGAEAYLAGIFPAGEAYSVYQPFPELGYPPGSCYEPRYHQPLNQSYDSI